jgi:hypothetical protein
MHEEDHRCDNHNHDCCCARREVVAGDLTTSATAVIAAIRRRLARHDDDRCVVLGVADLLGLGDVAAQLVLGFAADAAKGAGPLDRLPGLVVADVDPQAPYLRLPFERRSPPRW